MTWVEPMIQVPKGTYYLTQLAGNFSFFELEITIQQKGVLILARFLVDW